MGVWIADLQKMSTELAQEVQYFMPLEGGEVHRVNDWLGKKLGIRFGGIIHCVSCGKKISKAYGQGFCFPCFQESPEAAECIIHPEKCRGHLGEGRDPQWEYEHHVKPHVVYMALTTEVKVGVTRESQIPHRWIDQGADAAMVIGWFPYRKLAGEAEVALKAHFTDKTNWINMVTGKPPREVDWNWLREDNREKLPTHLHRYLVNNGALTEIRYPVLTYAEKVRSLNLMNMPEYTGRLTGIRGQYLLFEDGMVFNVRNHSGFRVQLELNLENP